MQRGSRFRVPEGQTTFPTCEERSPAPVCRRTERLRNNPGRALENNDLRHETGGLFLRL
jgi:hypothetical protein